VGIVMGVSNILTGAAASLICIWEIRKICKEYQITFF